jgi:dTDP-4-amino-4,6-dideoxygalactose transaminase
MTFLDTIPRFASPYGPPDYCAAMGALLGRETASPAPFRRLLGDRPAFWSASGRHALWMILAALDLPAGSGVAVPLYTDPSVHDAVRAAGLRNVFVDIDPRTLTLDPAHLAQLRDQIKAVVVVHFFGHLAAMREILEVVPGLPVIEDTAHAPLSYLGNQMAGTFGAACFYSFASTKYWPAGGGGLAMVNDPALAARLAEIANRLPPPSLWEEFANPTKQFAKAWVFRRPLYGLIGRPLRARAERMGVLEPRLIQRRILRGQAAVAVRQVRDFPIRVELHRANSLRLLELLGACPGLVLPLETPGTRYNYHLFPILVADRQERDRMVQALLARNVDTSRIYFDMLPHARLNGYAGGCPVAEAAIDRMLTLPNHSMLSARDVEHVAAAFLSALSEVRASRSERPGSAILNSSPEEVHA